MVRKNGVEDRCQKYTGLSCRCPWPCVSSHLHQRLRVDAEVLVERGLHWLWVPHYCSSTSFVLYAKKIEHHTSKFLHMICLPSVAAVAILPGYLPCTVFMKFVVCKFVLYIIDLMTLDATSTVAKVRSQPSAMYKTPVRVASFLLLLLIAIL